MAKSEELDATKKLYQENEKKWKTALRNTESELRSANEASDNERQKMRAQINGLEKVKGELVMENESLKTKVTKYEAENFDLADVQVVRVAGKSVFLNIGEADGLRSNMTFAVYDSQVNNFEKNQEKAKIEVLAVTGAHTARARVNDEDPLYPVKKGDNIVTPTWDPGYNVPIALAGIVPATLPATTGSVPPSAPTRSPPAPPGQAGDCAA